MEETNLTSNLSSNSTSNIMIHYFNKSFNNFTHIFSFQKLYDSYVFNSLSSLSCPKCHHCDFKLNTHYHRYFIDQPASCLSIQIAVVYCPHCNSYHSILPSFLFPFHSYTYSFVLDVVYSFYFGSNNNNKSHICKLFQISRSTLNKFLRAYSKETTRFLYLFHNLTLDENLLSKIRNDKQAFSSFLQSFIKRSNFKVFLLFLPKRSYSYSFFPLIE